jgi:putative N6-adenine-specific DNA methylase
MTEEYVPRPGVRRRPAPLPGEMPADAARDAAPSPAAGPPVRRVLVTTAPGLEALLADELRELGLTPEVEPGGVVVVNGDWREAAIVATRSRIASRLLVSLRRFSAGNQAMLYHQVRRIDWRDLFPPTFSFAVHVAGAVPEGADFTLPFAALKIKDAVCDEFRKLGGPRPSVDRRNPDVRLSAHFFQGQCELSLDLAGEPLHRRGYRKDGAEAPIRENRAAALLRFAGYDGSAPLVDPFCGSGTIVVEAALLALRRAPGLLRGAESYAGARVYPEYGAALAAVREGAAAEALPALPAPIVGSDVSDAVLVAARANARAAGLDGVAGLRLERRDAREVEVSGGWVVSNPPYGERLEDQESAGALIGEFVRQLKHHGAGCRLALVLPRGPVEKSVGLKPARRLAVESGPLGLRYLLFEMYAGRRRPGG